MNQLSEGEDQVLCGFMTALNENSSQPNDESFNALPPPSPIHHKHPSSTPTSTYTATDPSSYPDEIRNMILKLREQESQLNQREIELQSKEVFVSAQTKLIELAASSSSVPPSTPNSTPNPASTPNPNPNPPINQSDLCLEDLETTPTTPEQQSNLPTTTTTTTTTTTANNNIPKPRPKQQPNPFGNTSLYVDHTSLGKQRLKDLKNSNRFASSRNGFLRIGASLNSMKDKQPTASEELFNKKRLLAKQQQQHLKSQQKNKKDMNTTFVDPEVENRLLFSSASARAMAPVISSAVPPSSSDLDKQPELKKRVPNARKPISLAQQKLGFKAVNANSAEGFFSTPGGLSDVITVSVDCYNSNSSAKELEVLPAEVRPVHSSQFSIFSTHSHTHTHTHTHLASLS